MELGGETYPKDIQLLDPLDKPRVTSPATMTSSFTTEENGEKAEKIPKFDDEMMLQKKIEGLENEIDDLKKRIHDLESQNQKHDKLEKELKKIKTERDQLQTEIKLFSTENEVLAKKLETLTKELEKVAKTCEELEKKETKLAIGQVAWLLEKEIWKAVLPDEEPGTVAIFHSMEEWLDENKLSAEGIAAQKRWDDFKLKLNWKERSWREKHHRNALYLLKKLRKEVAHPPKVDLKVARQQLIEGDYVANYQKESCTDIIDMLINLYSQK